MSETFGQERAGPLRRRLRQRYQTRHGLQPPVGLAHESIEVGGIVREYWYARPENGEASAAPLLLVLHGAGGQGPGMAALTGLDRRGPGAGFVTIFPDGKRRIWNDLRGSQALRRREHIDDIGFLQALAAHFAATGRARSDAVYLAGISNGALKSEHLARHGLLPVAGIGLVAGPGTQASRATMPHPARSATVVVFGGTADPLIPYSGGPIGPLGRLAQRRGSGATDRGLAVAAQVIAADWAIANGIGSAPRIEPLPTAPGDLPVTRSTWKGNGRPPVALYRIQGGGHTWPGGAQYLPARFIGPVTHSVDATCVILEAFAAQETRNP